MNATGNRGAATALEEPSPTSSTLMLKRGPYTLYLGTTLQPKAVWMLVDSSYYF